MRRALSDRFEQARLREGYYASAPGDLHGAFKLMGPSGAELVILSSGFDLWEHVSVSIKHRIPNWTEMCFVKHSFWDETECVIQFHPPASEHVNYHPNCLHLWKPPYRVELPPSILVGPKERV